MSAPWSSQDLETMARMLARAGPQDPADAMVIYRQIGRKIGRTGQAVKAKVARLRENAETGI